MKRRSAARPEQIGMPAAPYLAARRLTAAPRPAAARRLTAAFVLMAALLASLAACDGSAKPSATPTQTSTATATVDAELSQRTTGFMTTLVAQDFDAAVASFDDKMRQALPAADLAAAWEQVTTQFGAYKAELRRRQESSGGYEAVIVTAQFETSPLDVRVVFDSDQRIAGLFFKPATGTTSAATADAWQPPGYADMGSVTQVDVTVGSGDWALPGTLTTPKEDGPWPAVVLVHGSGPNDRDETIGANKPFRDLALGLASRGIAVLAYDKRSLTHGNEMAMVDDLTVQQEVVADAVAAADLLRATKGVDPDRVFVLGHSLGGMLAPRIAQEAHGMAGLVIMAGAARPLEDLILAQSRYLAERDGTVTEQEQRSLDAVTKQVAKIRDPVLDASTPPAELFGVPASYWLDLRKYRPTAVAAELDLPMLVLQGERDYQVTMADFKLWKEALAGRSDVTLTGLPGLNHLMMPAPTPHATPSTTGTTGTTESASPSQGALSGPEEYEVAGHVAPEVVDAIASFILG